VQSEIYLKFWNNNTREFKTDYEKISIFEEIMRK